MCSLSPYRTGDIEVSYEFLPEFWGQGYALEAVDALLKWGFANLNISYVIAVTQKQNERSKKLLTSLNMSLVEEYFEFNELQCLYKITKDEFENIKKENEKMQ